MAVDTVRRLSKPNGQQQLLSDQITHFDWIDSDEIITENLLVNSDLEYPFEDQHRRCKSFEFTTDPMFGSPTKATGVIEIREESGLIFLILEQDAPKPDTIFNQLSAASKQSIEIEGDFSPTYSELCDFIRAANEVVKIESPPGINDVTARIKQGENLPIETARLRFEHNGDSRRVTYSDGQLEIPLDLDSRNLLEQVAQKDTFREYVVQLFETIFTSQ